MFATTYANNAPSIAPIHKGVRSKIAESSQPWETIAFGISLVVAGLIAVACTTELHMSFEDKATGYLMGGGITVGGLGIFTILAGITSLALESGSEDQSDNTLTIDPARRKKAEPSSSDGFLTEEVPIEPPSVITM